MKPKFFIYLALIVLVVIVAFAQISLLGCEKAHNNPIANKDILAENDSVQILCVVVDSAKDEFDVPVIALWMHNKSDGSEKKLLQTVRPDWHCWYMSDGDQWIDVPIDSITAISRAYIINDNPLQLIVEGVPDCRNEFSHFIDVDRRTAKYIPANSGFLGSTEEGYLIFRSYRYVSDPDIAGRHTFLQVFDEDGVMVDSLDLEHVILEKYNSPYAKK